MNFEKGLKKAANYIEKRIKDLKKNLKPFKNYNFATPEYRKKQERKRKKLLASVYETNKEKKLYRQYEHIVRESFKHDNPERKFKLSHVKQLGIKHQIFLLYTKKDIGKTRQLGKELFNIRAKDPDAQVVLIRNTKEELEGFKLTMNNSIHWPTWSNGEYIWWKDDIRNSKKKKPKPCGFMAYTTGYGFVKWQGSEFDNVKFWMWDECNSVEGGIDEKVFMQINVFLSSIIRDKENVQGYMFGNLLEKNNIFLSRLGVSSRTRLKIFPVHEDFNKNKPLLSTLLYMNTGDLFKGIEQQKGLATQFLDQEEQLSLLSNRPGVFNVKSQYEKIDLKDYIPQFAFVFRRTTGLVAGRAKKADYILYLYLIPNSYRFVTWIELFNEKNIEIGFNFIACPELEVANNYEHVAAAEEKEFGETYIDQLHQILESGELWFGNNNSQDIFEEMWPGWKSKYIKEDEKTI